jgi:hypothetical protein
MSEQSKPMQMNMRVSGFVRYLVTQGHAVGSLNYALATVRTYAKLATQASTIVPQSFALIKTVVGYSSKEGRRVDEARAVARIAHKKAQAVSISQTQARALERHKTTRRRSHETRS